MKATAASTLIFLALTQPLAGRIIASSKGAAGFAVPIESVPGPPTFGSSIALGSGVSPEMPAKLDARPKLAWVPTRESVGWR